MRSRQLELLILLGPFHLKVFCGSVMMWQAQNRAGSQHTVLSWHRAPDIRALVYNSRCLVSHRAAK